MNVARIRHRLGLSVAQFADLLHVHHATIYRWESTDTPNPDPLQETILHYLDEHLDPDVPPYWVAGVVDLVRRRRPLAALSDLLGVIDEA